MRFCFFLFFCVAALTACSPRHYAAKQASGAFTAAIDSTAVRHIVEASVTDAVRERIDSILQLQAVAVRETYSEPDSSGRQYVSSRTVTTVTAQKTSTVQRDSDRRVAASKSSDSSVVAVAVQEHHDQEEVTAAVEQSRPRLWPWILIGAIVLVLLVFCAAWCRKEGLWK